MITSLFDHGALQATERLVQFTSARHRILADNIANLSNPYYKTKDVDPASFQSSLRDAIDRRRATATPQTGKLRFSDTRQVTFQDDTLTLNAQPTHDNLLFHDQNDRDLERTMQRLAENTMAHNTGIELLRNQFDMIRLAIRERF